MCIRDRSNSALVHWLFLASNLAYDWRISASLVSTNWLYLVMLQCIWSSVVPLARTLGPLSPLLLQTCFWAAPSASSMEKVKWSLISWPSEPFNKKPVGGRISSWQKKLLSRAVVIWPTPASTADTLLDLTKAMLSQLSVEWRRWPNWRKLAYHAQVQVYN